MTDLSAAIMHLGGGGMVKGSLGAVSADDVPDGTIRGRDFVWVERYDKLREDAAALEPGGRVRAWVDLVAEGVSWPLGFEVLPRVGEWVKVPGKTDVPAGLVCVTAVQHFPGLPAARAHRLIVARPS